MPGLLEFILGPPPGDGSLTASGDQIPGSVVSAGSTASPLSGATTFLPLPTGVAATDTANLNTVLARGGRIRPNPLALTAAYSLTAPLVLAQGGNTDVDFGGCTFTLTGTFNMLQNYAVANPAATAVDAGTTAGSSVVVSPTLAAVAVVGQALAVVAAGPQGGDTAHGPNNIWFYGTVQSIAGNNITLTSSNVNGIAATATLSGATAYLFNRDSNVTIQGGTWNAANIWLTQASRYTAGFNSHQIRLRRIDGLTVRNIALQMNSWGGNGKGWAFGVNPGDCTNFLIENVGSNLASTCVQGDGPLARGAIRNCYGSTQDDQVALGCVGFQGNDVEGDIVDVEVDGIFSAGSWTSFKAFSGQGANGAQRVCQATVRTVKGSVQNSPINVTDYTGAGTGPTTVELDDITAAGPAGNQTIVNSAQFGSYTTKPQGWTPADSGLLHYTYDPADAASTFQPGNGFIYLAQFKAPRQVTVANLIAWVTAAGVTLTANQNFAGIYDQYGHLWAKTADQSAVWNSIGEKIMALTAQGGFSLTLPGGPGVFYWAALLCWGTTNPTFAAKVSQVTIDPGFGTGTLLKLRGGYVNSSGQTSLAATISGLSNAGMKSIPWLATT